MGGSFARGTTLKIGATFLDVNGNPVTPAGANVWISYFVGDATAPTNVKLTMTISGSTGSALWNSAPANAGAVYYHIRSTDTNPIAYEDSFTLTANPANPPINILTVP